MDWRKLFQHGDKKQDPMGLVTIRQVIKVLIKTVKQEPVPIRIIEIKDIRKNNLQG
jgi:hypothetical protein